MIRKARGAALALILAALAGPALGADPPVIHTQNGPAQATPTTPYRADGTIIDPAAGAATLGPTTPASITGTTSPATITSTSAQALAAAATSRTFLSIDNESATATIACRFGATAVINAAGSYTIPAGWTRTWDSFPVPTEALNCISSAASSPATIGAY